MVSGKINEYPNDKAKWKTNFRCALNGLTQFKMIHDNSKDLENPHKIYRIVRPESKTPDANRIIKTANLGLEEAESHLSSSIEHQQCSNSNPQQCSNIQIKAMYSSTNSQCEEMEVSFQKTAVSIDILCSDESKGNFLSY